MSSQIRARTPSTFAVLERSVLLLVVLCSLFTSAASYADQTPSLDSSSYYSGDYLVNFNGRDFDGSSTSFEYLLCWNTGLSGNSFESLGIELPSCDPELIQSVECSPVQCSHSSASTQLSFTPSLQPDGVCMVVRFSFPGDVPLATVPVMIDSTLCDEGGQPCEEYEMSGPGCPILVPTPDPDPDPTPDPPITPPVQEPEPALSCSIDPNYEVSCNEIGEAVLKLGTQTDATSSSLEWNSSCGVDEWNEDETATPIISIDTTGWSSPRDCSISLTLTNELSGQAAECSRAVTIPLCERGCNDLLLTDPNALVVDRCGVCGGDGTTCDCISTATAPIHDKFLAKAYELARVVIRSSRPLRDGSKSDRSARRQRIRRILQLVRDLRVNVEVPEQILVCTAYGANCTRVHDEAFKEAYRDSINQFYREAVLLGRQLSMRLGQSELSRRLKLRSRGLMLQAFKLVDQAVIEGAVCSDE